MKWDVSSLFLIFHMKYLKKLNIELPILMQEQVWRVHSKNWYKYEINLK